MDDLYETLAEILDQEEIKKEDLLKDFEDWDSLAILSIIAFVDSKYGITLYSEELENLSKAQDLDILIKSKEKSL